jgi:hypothetical protein
MTGPAIATTRPSVPVDGWVSVSVTVMVLLL